MMKIENWHSYEVSDGKEIIYGNVYGNPQFEDGTYIHTSFVQSFHSNKRFVKTLNSKYELGTPAILKKEKE